MERIASGDLATQFKSTLPVRPPRVGHHSQFKEQLAETIYVATLRVKRRKFQQQTGAERRFLQRLAQTRFRRIDFRHDGRHGCEGDWRSFGWGGGCRWRWRDCSVLGRPIRLRQLVRVVLVVLVMLIRDDWFDGDFGHNSVDGHFEPWHFIERE